MSSDSSVESDNATKSSTVCVICRQRKTKCNRRFPRCNTCVKLKVECRYLPSGKKPGLRAGYVTRLEERIEQAESDINQLKRRRPLVETPPLDHSDPRLPVQSPNPATSPVSFGGTAKRQRLLGSHDAAIHDLATLPLAYLSSLADLWFKESQPWCPILDRTHIETALQNLVEPVDAIHDLELRAVLALQLSYSSQAIVLGYAGRSRLSAYLRSQVLAEALTTASVSSLRALLIIALLDYGNDTITSTQSLLAICRRTCESLGLFSQLLMWIEQQSPTHVGPPSLTMSGTTIAATWGQLGLDSVSSLGVSWRDASAALMDHLNSVAYVSTLELQNSYQTHVHLCAIGLQPVHVFLNEHRQADTMDIGPALARCDALYENLMRYVTTQSAASYTLLADGHIEFDPCLVHTSVLTYAAVIIMYQRLIDSTSDFPDTAVTRCFEACEQMVLCLRGLSDADIELNTPVLAHLLFVAARFKLVMYKRQSQPREASFDTLMHGISMCSRRWYLARRVDLVLRAALLELEGNTTVTLPPEFWTLRLSHLDISETMKAWVTERVPFFGIEYPNGPYA